MFLCPLHSAHPIFPGRLFNTRKMEQTKFHIEEQQKILIDFFCLSLNSVVKISLVSKRRILHSSSMYLMLLLRFSFSPGDCVEFLCCINRELRDDTIEAESIDSPPSDKRFDVLLCFSHIEYAPKFLMSEYVSERLPSLTTFDDPRLAILSIVSGQHHIITFSGWGGQESSGRRC